MNSYCTLFDTNYMVRGLVLYQSMCANLRDAWTLYVLPMDSDAEYVLNKMALPNMVIVDPGPFELTMGLSEAKANRTHQEYCWTCASNLTCYLMAWHNTGDMTYLDADQMFFADASTIFCEHSIGIVPHNLIPSKRHLEVNGKYNVGVVTFRNDRIGKACVIEWAEQCRRRCSASVGCGDQQYLDSWPAKYGSAVCIIQNPGIGLAPWNLANYSITERAGVVYADGAPVVIYHYHEYIHGQRLTNYELRQQDIDLIYKPYIAANDAMTAKIESLHLQTH